jgi:putative ATPase
MENLFAKTSEPLAYRLRPDKWEGFIGQSSVVNQIRSLKKPTSILFYGPPGSGKTTLAQILVSEWNLPKRHLSAVTSGVKELREVMDESKKLGTIALFLDEIHRYSASQQDALLPWVENGSIVLISATTENPSFRINRALLSRMHVFRLQSLAEGEEETILENAITKEGEGREFSDSTKREILLASGGDARKLLGILEGIFFQTKPKQKIELEMVQEFLSSRLIQYDKNKDQHYDVISAFIKSLRGSNPDAALVLFGDYVRGRRRPIVYCSEIGHFC